MAEQATIGAAQVCDLFDAKAATWSSKYDPGGRLTGRLDQLTAAVLGWSEPDAPVLDLGCGTGDLARQLAAAGLQVTGCDISAQMLARAARSDADHSVAWTALDTGWRTLPFADGMFEGIVASSVLEYVEDPILVLRECARVLRPGGTLLFTVPDMRHPVRWLEFMLSPAARVPVAQALSCRIPRLASYLTYLAISRQRHSSRWWDTAGQCSGLRRVAPVSCPAGRACLRILAFERGRTGAAP